MTTTLAFPFAGPDHLCCGHLGRLGFVWEAGHVLQRDDWVTTAESRVCQLLETRAKTNSMVLYENSSQIVPSPSFMQGTAGIGYQLARFLRPDIIPDVLRFQLKPSVKET